MNIPNMFSKSVSIRRYATYVTFHHVTLFVFFQSIFWRENNSTFAHMPTITFMFLPIMAPHWIFSSDNFTTHIAGLPFAKLAQFVEDPAVIPPCDVVCFYIYATWIAPGCILYIVNIQTTQLSEHVQIHRKIRNQLLSWNYSKANSKFLLCKLTSTVTLILVSSKIP